MPIVFQQAQPLDVNLAANYGAQRAGGGGNSGAMQQEAADNAAQRQLQATLAGERVAADSGQQRADREWRSEEASRNRGLDRELTATRANAEVLQINERANAQANLQQAELSQAEKVHYQRLRQAVSTIDTDENLSAEDKAVMKTQIQTGINAYAVRDAHATAKMKQMQLQDLHEQRAAAIALETMDDAQRAQAIQKRLWTDTDGVKYYRDNSGNIKPLEKPKAEKPADFKPYPRPSVSDMAKDAAAYAEAKMGGRKRSDFANDPAGAAEFERHLTEKWDALHVEEDRKQTLWEQAHGPNPSQTGQPAPGQKLGIPNSQPAPAVPQSPPPPAVDLWDFSKMTEDQKKVRDPFARQIEATVKADLPPAEKARRQMILQKQAELAMQYPFNAPPDAVAKMAELQRELNRPLTQPKQATPQAGLEFYTPY